MPPTDTDALRADCSSVIRSVDGLGSTDSAFEHEIATRRQVQTVVFVRHVDGLGTYDSALSMRPLPQLCSFLTSRSRTFSTACSSGKLVTDSDAACRYVDLVELRAKCLVAAPLVV